MPRHLPQPWEFWPYACLPLALLVGTVRHLLLVYQLRRVGVEALGQVVSQRKVKGRHVLTVRFATQHGQPIEGESAYADTNLERFDGDAVAVVYDPARPARFLLTHELTVNRSYWLVGAGVVVLAGLILYAL